MSRGMMLSLRSWLFVAAALVLAVPAAAQDRLIEGTRELGAFGHFGQDLGPVPDIAGLPFVGGGRFAVRGSEAFDLRTGVAVPLGPGVAVAFDAARPRVFVARADGIWAVDVRDGAAALFAAGATADLTSCQHAASADVLMCVSSRAVDQQDLLRVDAAGRHVLLTTRFAFGFPLPNGVLTPEWILTPDATRVYFARCAALIGTFCQSDLAMFDVATGTLTTLDPVAAGFGFLGSLYWDDRNERLFTSVTQRVYVMNRDLQVLGGAFVGGRCHQLAVSPHTGRLYVNRMDYYYSTPWSTLVAFDSATYRAVEPEVVRSAGTSCGPLRVLTAPGAPRDVRATVGGNTVSLAWKNVGDASDFVLEAGSASGRTDLVMHLGPATQMSFAGVPPGVYYLRLRGGNAFGGGRPSNEVRVVVP